MMLAPRYLSVLTEMGIPVWELRSQDTELELTSTLASRAVEFTESLPDVDCLIVLAEQDHNDEAIRLLHAMLFSIGVTLDNSAIVSANQLHQLSTLTTQHKVLIAFGEQLIPSFLDSQTKDHEHSEADAKLKIIVSTSLTVLLSSPDKKALVWQDLQLLKAVYQAEVLVQSDLVIE